RTLAPEPEGRCRRRGRRAPRTGRGRRSRRAGLSGSSREPAAGARSLCSAVVTVDSDIKRKRQLILLGAGGIAVMVLALVGSLFPVHASFPGERSYNCGSP